MATASASGIEWLTATNSQSNGPSCSRSPSLTSSVYGLDAVLVELGLEQREGQLRADQRDVRRSRRRYGHRADVVLVAVREHDASTSSRRSRMDVEVGQDQVDAGLVVLGEEHAAVDDEQPAVVLEDGHVAADLAEAAERDDAQAARRAASAGRRARDADGSKDSPHHARHVPARHVARMTFVQQQLSDALRSRSCVFSCEVCVRAVPRRRRDRS